MAATAHGTLTPGEVESVDIEPGWRGVEVVNRSKRGVIWVRFDGEDPEVEGADTYAVVGVRAFDVPRPRAPEFSSIRLLADEALAYSVEAT